LLAWQGIKIANVDEKTDKALITDKNILLANSNRDGQDKSLPILLTSKDVDTNSVRVTTSPASDHQNLVFKFGHKNSAEIKAIAKRRPRGQAKVMKNGVVIAETPEGGFGGHVQIVDGQTNFIGLTLTFSNYDQAKLAEKALRGD
jgi:hypothetical protein